MIGILGLALGVLLLGGSASEVRAGEIVPFKDARIKFEVNATDGDGGIQIFVDADGWKWLRIYDPNGREIFETVTRGRIAKQGGTELFLESAEPDFVELPLGELLARFPEGTYPFKARGLDGEMMVGAATVTHDIPDGPKLVSPVGPTPLQDPNDTLLRWESVPPPNGSPIVGYEVLVVQSSTGLPGLPTIPLDVIMPPTATSLAVPPGFLQPDTVYEWEVLAIEAGGNQTLSSSTLRTKP